MSALGRVWTRRFDERGLRLLFGVFFLALAVPAAVLVAQAFSQLRFEALRNTQIAAEELVARLDEQLRTAVIAEDARPFGDFSFLVVAGDAAASFVQRSSLSAFPPAGALPGVLGHFQVDAAGRFSSPLLPAPGVDPATYGIGAEEQAARAARVEELRAVLAQNRLVRPVRDEAAQAAVTPLAERAGASTDVAAPAAPSPSARESAPAISAAPAAAPPADSAQAEFDKLSVGALSSKRAGNAIAEEARSAEQNQAERAQRADSKDAERRKRVEQAYVPEPKRDAPAP